MAARDCGHIAVMEMGWFFIGPNLGWSHLMPAYKWKAQRIAYAAGKVNSACSVAGKLNAAKVNGTLRLH